MRTLDLSGVKFNKLTALEKVSGGKNSLWKCRCDCGNETFVSASHLKSNHTKSCGCNRNGNPKHGHSKERTYRSWKEMRSRCLKPTSEKAKWYRFKGITIAPEWNNFYVFLNDMGVRPEGTSIDRINPNWGYYPENCRWATPKQQAETNSGCFGNRI